MIGVQAIRARILNYPIKPMNTKGIKDKVERKKLKRAARKKQPPKPKRTDPRGSHKPKVKKKGPGAPTRR